MSKPPVLTNSDSEAIFQNYSDADIAKNFMDAPFTSLAQAERLIDAFQTEFKQGKAITWAISLKGTGACIGTCSYIIESSSCAEMGYDLGKAHWGNGLMGEALRAIIDYGFECLGLQELKADTLSHNSRSINLLKRLGFHLDAVRDNNHFLSIKKE